jgi:hypothetical protein
MLCKRYTGIANPKQFGSRIANPEQRVMHIPLPAAAGKAFIVLIMHNGIIFITINKTST